MDEIVKAAIAKWPNVPHCYGWLALDARGQWRMRDERCQALKLPGDIIRHPALIDFINRNYQCDDQGCWYFQNGPQRVYVELEATPFIVHTAPDGLQLHTGQVMPPLTAAFMDESGRIILVADKLIALVDDRDLSEIMRYLRMQDQIPDDDQILTWMATGGASASLSLMSMPYASQQITLLASSLHEILAAAGLKARPRESSK